MPVVVTTARFQKDGRSVEIKVEGPNWSAHLFPQEVVSDTSTNLVIVQLLSDLLKTNGYKEE